MNTELINITYQEIGALLAAVGSIMHGYSLCAEAVLDGGSDHQLLEIMSQQFGISSERAILLCRQGVTLKKLLTLGVKFGRRF